MIGSKTLTPLLNMSSSSRNAAGAPDKALESARSSFCKRYKGFKSTDLDSFVLNAHFNCEKKKCELRSGHQAFIFVIAFKTSKREQVFFHSNVSYIIAFFQMF